MGGGIREGYYPALQNYLHLIIYMLVWSHTGYSIHGMSMNEKNKDYRAG